MNSWQMVLRRGKLADDALVAIRRPRYSPTPPRCGASTTMGNGSRCVAPECQPLTAGPPVFLQAGASDVAATSPRVGRVVFVTQPETPEAAREFARSACPRERFGRRPDDIKVLPGHRAHRRETSAIAHEAVRCWRVWRNPQAGLSTS